MKISPIGNALKICTKNLPRWLLGTISETKLDVSGLLSPLLKPNNPLRTMNYSKLLQNAESTPNIN